MWLVKFGDMVSTPASVRDITDESCFQNCEYLLIVNVTTKVFRKLLLMIGPASFISEHNHHYCSVDSKEQ
jgi:hypothetical protein